MIFCLVQGDAIKSSFPIDTSQYATIGHLKVAIKDMKENTFSSVDANSLTLRRVDIIQTKDNQEMTIKECEGEELHSFESVGQYFEEPSISTNIRIIVESATTGKCLPMVYLSNKKFADLLLISSFFLSIFFPFSHKEPPMKKRRLWKENPKKRSVIQSSSNEVRQVPISQSEFTLVRENHLLYVDKTYWLSKLNLNCGYYFVS